MSSPRDALAVLEDASADGRLDVLCDRVGLDLVVVFGSTADPRVAAPRDLDIAVRFSPSVEADPVAATNELIELTGDDTVDVLDLRRADVVARSRALGPPCIPLYERDAGMFALSQMAALTEAMDTAHMRRRDLELLARR